MKTLNNSTARRARVRTVMGHPAVSVTVAISVALTLTLFGATQVMAVVAVPSSTETATPSPTSTVTSDPTPTTVPAPAPSATSTATPSPTPGAAPSASLQSFAAPGEHHVLALIEGSNFQANYLPVDQPVPDASPFQTFRVRFRLHNSGTAAITTTPRLEYRAEGGTFLVVPEKPTLGIPFHVDREWVPSLGLSNGTIESPLGADISAADLQIGTDTGLAVNGHHSMGANPDRPITLPSASYTEEEFTVTLSMDAKYLTDYQLRITDGGTPLTGTDVATIRVGGPPAVRLSPGQQQGVAVPAPTKATAAGIAYPLVSAPQSSPAILSATGVSGATAVSAVYSPSTASYPLVAAALTAATYEASIHGPYSLTSDQCAVCHRAHTAKGPNLLKIGSQSTLCFMCHDGAGATSNVQAEYQLDARPANDSTTRDYYSHDAEAPSHTDSGLDEFGRVSNRHSTCADCHNSHKALAAPDSIQLLDTQTPQSSIGWSAAGPLAGVSGVSVINGAAGTAPQYTFLSGAIDAADDEAPVTNINPISLEYQLCLKCHSGFTKLLPPIAGKPSLDALDKGVEFNPANPSFHPIEAPGTNKTAKMDLNLAATSTSPFKLWDFNSTSTIRCLNCHTSGSTPGPNPPAIEPVPPLPLPQPGSALALHTSSNRGILLRNYQDRVLKSGIDTATTKAAYSAGDFALCYVCHGEEPYVNATGDAASNATNFSLHGQHLTGLENKGDGGTDIDTPGAGQGNAICAECHFRIHSTTYKADTKAADGTTFTQAIPGSRLVNFAPNVQPNGTVLSWTPASTTVQGSCTLTCHGHPHDGTTTKYPAIPVP